eukprot:3648510-Pyramimonas_sp.AAC.1
MINDMIHTECTDCLGRIDEARRARLQAICRSWSVKRRKLAIFSVSDPVDEAPASIEQSARNLANFWGDVHRCPDVLPEPDPDVLAALRSEIQSVSPGIQWELMEHEFRSI